MGASASDGSVSRPGRRLGLDPLCSVPFLGCLKVSRMPGITALLAYKPEEPLWYQSLKLAEAAPQGENASTEAQK